MSAASRLVVVGEALVDVLRDGTQVERRAGGGPANIAVAAARLGVPVRLVTALGGDADGDLVRRWLLDAGVDLRAEPSPQPTSVAVGTVRGDETSYAFDLHWDLPSSTVHEVLDDPPACVHVGSLGAVVEPGAAAVLRLVEALPATVLVSLDPNVRPGTVGLDVARGRIEALRRRADVVKASADDLRALHAGEEPLRVAREWVAQGTALVVVTEGAAGATAVTAAHEVTAAGLRVPVVDTVGAGDAFMGMLLARLVGAGARPDALSSDELGDVLHDCVAAAAVSCTRRGADPPNRTEVAALRRH